VKQTKLRAKTQRVKRKNRNATKPVRKRKSASTQPKAKQHAEELGELWRIVYQLQGRVHKPDVSVSLPVFETLTDLLHQVLDWLLCTALLPLASQGVLLHHLAENEAWERYNRGEHAAAWAGIELARLYKKFRAQLTSRSKRSINRLRDLRYGFKVAKSNWPPNDWFRREYESKCDYRPTGQMVVWIARKIEKIRRVKTHRSQWRSYASIGIATENILAQFRSELVQVAVQQPINADGTSKFKANGRAVIPVKFALSQGTGPFVFESIGSDNSTDNDYSYVSFAPTTTLTFNGITELSAVYAFTQGDCHGGALRWSVRTSDGHSLFIYYGDPASFTNCTGANSQTGANMIGLQDLRYDTSQYPGGTFYDNYAHAQTLMGRVPIIRVSLVLDGGWQYAPDGDQRLTLTSATVRTGTFPDTFTPQAESSMTPTCPTHEAYIGMTKVGGADPAPVNEPQTIQPQDEDGMFRIVDCKYMYNLATSSLMGPGKYNVFVTIDGTMFDDVATFELK
jgi:hypothetical protein